MSLMTQQHKLGVFQCVLSGAAKCDPAKRISSPPTHPPTHPPTANSFRLTWLHQFQMEARLLEQLMALAPRMTACSGSGMFAGISTVIEDLVGQLPVDLPATTAERQAEIQAARPVVLALQVC